MLLQEPIPARRFGVADRDDRDAPPHGPADLLIAPLAVMKSRMEQSCEGVARAETGLDHITPPLARLDVVVCDEAVDAVPGEGLFQVASKYPLLMDV
jgi:hypothetical protein